MSRVGGGRPIGRDTGRPVRARIVGVDLARSLAGDQTAVLVGDATITGGRWECALVAGWQRRGMTWARQIAGLERIARREALVHGRALVVIDRTGLGSGPAEQLADRLVGVDGVHVSRVAIVGGHSDSFDVDPATPSVGKTALVSQLAVALGGQLGLADAFPADLARELHTQLAGYTAREAAGGRVTYGNDSSIAAHDDLVVAAALVAYGAGHVPPAAVRRPLRIVHTPVSAGRAQPIPVGGRPDVPVVIGDPTGQHPRLVRVTVPVSGLEVGEHWIVGDRADGLVADGAVTHLAWSYQPWAPPQPATPAARRRQAGRTPTLTAGMPRTPAADLTARAGGWPTTGDMHHDQ